VISRNDAWAGELINICSALGGCIIVYKVSQLFISRAAGKLFIYNKYTQRAARRRRRWPGKLEIIIIKSSGMQHAAHTRAARGIHA